MKLKKLSIVILFLCIFLLGACQSGNSDGKAQNKESETFVYYIDKNETQLVAKPFTPTSTERKYLVEEYMKALGTKPDDLTLQEAIPDEVRVEKYVFSESNRLTIYFDSDYGNLTGIKEVLCRASIVKTLCQIEDIEDIEFYVAGQPLKGINDKVVGAMKDTDFIDESSAENVLVNIYFANEKGDKMVSSLIKITSSYDSNVSIEKLIINRLIKGPIEEKMKKTLPDGTQLIKVRTKDGVCYVDFNEKFLDKVEGVEPEVVIYSVVNSLVQLSTINKVQFTIDGQTKKIYREDIPFDGTFERNLDLIEERSK